MKLKNEFVKLQKDIVYDMYWAIVYDAKNYDSITRSKMLDSILKEYEQQYYLFYICTKRELDFLAYVINRKLNSEDIQKYEWEINELNKKCIFSKVTYEVFEEQKHNVLDALEYYKTNPRCDEEFPVFMVGFIKKNGQMLLKPFVSMLQDISHKKSEDIDVLFGNPLFHFYCDIHNEYFPFSSEPQEIITYRDYFDISDELEDARKKYGIAGCLNCDIREPFDFFYYGFPIQNQKVKKMVNEIKKMPLSGYLFRIIDEARLLYNYCQIPFFFHGKLLNLVYNALEEMPCAAMNGFTPKDYFLEKEKEKNFDLKLPKIPQNNAHLCRKASDEFYNIYFALLKYTNEKYNIISNMPNTWKQNELDVEKLYPINDYLWDHKDILDDFVKENPYHFSKEELEICAGFKTAVTSNYFVIVGYQREYTEILGEDGKLYMVKGIRCDFDQLIPSDDLPKFISTTLLMFKGNIIFNSFFSHLEIEFGNDMKQAILEEYAKAIKYYHL